MKADVLKVASSLRPQIRQIGLTVTALLAFPAIAFAQSPWERAATNLEATFTGPLARSLALVTFERSAVRC